MNVGPAEQVFEEVLPYLETLVGDWKVPIYSCLGTPLFSACPQHGASPLL